MKAKIVFVIAVLACIISSGFINKTEQDPALRKIKLVFHNRIGNRELVLGDSATNILGSRLIIEKFRYYVSNFSVTDEKGNLIKLPVDYFLVDEADASSKIITLTVPDVSITRIGFLLGVDSIRNVSGIQTGALDPLKGMFWTWNSGYVMAKLEGSSEEVHLPGGHFTYHIGGFRKGMDVTKNISLSIEQKDNTWNEVNIGADINHWFKGSSELKIGETPVCHSPGALAMRIADNYRTMFSINSIH